MITNKRKITLLVCVVMLLTSTVFAGDAEVGDQTLSVPGVGFYLNPDGKPNDTRTRDNGNDTYTQKVTNMTPVPNGTTQVNVSWGKDALQGAGKGKNFNSNGHTTPNGQSITNGQQVTDTFGERMLDSDALSNFKIEGYVTKNGQTYVQWSADVTVSKDMIQQWPQVPSSVQAMAQRHSDAGGNLNDPKFIKDMVAKFKEDYPTTNPNYDYEKALRTIMLDVDWFKNHSMASFPIGLVFETTETHESEEKKEKEKKKNQMPPEGKGPTPCTPSDPYVCEDSYREVFLYSYTTTTDLPTPPTRI
ncbi:hypothetical protein [Tissierella pigra]|uniref:Thioester domain-containing protein n=1 Tax=Tissierella pigra TaxID=2607614 RepID=A0A6N7XGK6_9FIRM|nr:hypothetical protein [Tissierella pigra]MSU01149.1 hypothetical protein [Tissierella pigra]